MGEQTAFERVHASFLDLERELDVFDLRVDGVPVWERLRTGLFHDVLVEADILDPAREQWDNDVGEYLRAAYKLARNVVVKNPYFSPERDVLVWGHQRRKQIDDRWWDIYCDPIYDELDLDYVHLEVPYKRGHRTPAKTGHLRYLDLIQFGAIMQRKLGLHQPTVTTGERRHISEIESRVNEEFGIECDLAGRVRTEVAQRNAEWWPYERLVRQIDPRVVVLVVSYGKETFIDVCKSLGVPVVELQHGLINRYHMGYHFPGKRTKEAFPDYFFAFGEGWLAEPELPIPDENAFAVGYPFLEQQVTDLADVAEREQVVFISQGTIGGSLSELAVDLNEAVPHHVVYKLHPEEYDTWRDRYPWLEESGVTVVADDEPSLYRLLAESTHQVGVSSTAIYEGLRFGVETYLAELPTVEYTRHLAGDGQAHLVSSAAELVELLDDGSAVNPDYTRFFAPDPIANVREALQAVDPAIESPTIEGRTSR